MPYKYVTYACRTDEDNNPFIKETYCGSVISMNGHNEWFRPKIKMKLILQLFPN